MNSKVEVKKVTRYNGKTGYDIFIEGVRVGEVHRYRNAWAYSSSKAGVYVNGYHCRTREYAIRVLVRACGGDY